MAAREVTQFSIVEFSSFRQDIGKVDPATYNARELHMATFAKFIEPGDPYQAQGGLENIQRIRVIQDGTTVTFEPVLKLPVNILEQKRREAEREKRKQEVIAKAQELANDPKKLEEFVRKVAKSILGAAAFELLKLSKGQKVSTKKLNAPPPRKRRSLSKEEQFERARAQDSRQRIEALRKGPKNLKSESASPTAA